MKSKTGMKKLNACLVGCGGFAGFTLKQYALAKNLQLLSLVDCDAPRVQLYAGRFGVPGFYTDLDQALEDEELDLVVIATPPYLHYEQSMKALKAGKHVLCEKPPALNTPDAQRLVDYAAEKGLKISCNYVMRHNPYYRVLKELIDSQVLGPVNSFCFRNYACDQFLMEDHWFWDKSKSGGIFIEHGVHFFDVMNAVLGNGRHAGSYCQVRADGGMEDRVSATVVYPGDVKGTFYHSFTQEKVVERNYLDVAFKWGYVTLHQWIPTAMTGEVWVDADCYFKLEDLFYKNIPANTKLNVETGIRKVGSENIPDFERPVKMKICDEEEFAGPIIKERHYQGGYGEKFNFAFHSRIKDGKTAAYGEAVRMVMEDFVSSIIDADHQPVLKGEDLVSGVALAQECDERAGELKY